MRPDYLEIARLEIALYGYIHTPEAFEARWMQEAQYANAAAVNRQLSVYLPPPPPGPGHNPTI